MRALIEDKRQGKPVRPTQPANDDGKVIDLMAALKKSLESGGGSRERAESVPATKTKNSFDMGTQLYLLAGWARQLESSIRSSASLRRNGTSDQA